MDYPNVVCDAHPELPPAPGFCVCVHVMKEAAAIAEYEDATSTRLGNVLCAACRDSDDVGIDLLILVCARCVEKLLAARAPLPRS
jgi:hypothetical protein